MHHQLSLYLCLWLGSIWLAGCQPTPISREYPQRLSGATVEIIETEQGYQLYRHGRPFLVRGAAGHGFLPELKARGGNSIRTWGPDSLQQYLDEADSLGLTVMAGLWATPGRQGMDYTDEAAVAAQRERLRTLVRRYKDHPALLMWNIGNEMDLFYDHDSLYYAIDDLARMIHEEDPNHPVTISVGCRPDWVSKIAKYCPQVDVLSVNVFAALDEVPARLSDPEYGWTGPYLITEWSHVGFWEVAMTDWDAPNEPASEAKVAENIDSYQASVMTDTTRCLGSYVFYWGHKQERTHTWYSMFTEHGEPTARVDAVEYLWRGKWPADRAPKVEGLRLWKQTQADQACYLAVNQTYRAEAFAEDPEGQALRYRWEVMPEGNYRSTFGGDQELRPDPMPELILSQSGAEVTFQAPQTPGAYRLFLTVLDSAGHAGTANLSFFAAETSFP
jgi:hypothetical protein